MKKSILLLAALNAILFPLFLFSQNIGIGTINPNSSAQIDISSTNRGLLIPRMTSSAVTSIANPAKGLMVYDSVKNQLMVNMGTPVAPNWQTIVANSGWNLTGNSGLNPANQFIGNTDNQPLRFRVNNIQAGELHPIRGNVFMGLRAGQSDATGYSNIAFGTDALKLNSDVGNLVAIGDSALYHNSTLGTTIPLSATANTAIGSKALYSNTEGFNNTANGFQSLYSNNKGVGNTAQGAQSLYSNSTGLYNTAVGLMALYNSTGGYENTAVGVSALQNTMNTSENTAVGAVAMYNNTTGNENTALGSGTMYSSNGSIAHYNTAIGYRALFSTTNSQYNTALGYNSGNPYDNGYNNVFLGANTGTNAVGYFNVIAIGKDVICTAPSQARIGNSFTSSIGGQVGWTTFSDGRYKKDIKENVTGLDFIMKLRPVTYHLNVSAISNTMNEASGRAMDASSKKAMEEKEQTLQTGFVAQDVELAAKAAGYDFSGVDKPKNDKDFYGLRYGAFVVPLVKAVQEQQQQMEVLKTINNNLQKQIDELKALIKK